MAHIAIDARIISSTTGRYVERLLHYLQGVDKTNRYTVLLRSKDLDFWKPKNKNFSVAAADFDNYSFAEQIGFKQLLDNLGADLVHFCMPQQPVLYEGRKVTTFHDLTLVKTSRSDKNWFVFHAKQTVGRFVFRAVARRNSHIIVPTEFTKNELLEFAKIPADKVTVTYESADVFIDKLEPYDHPFTRFILYVGRQEDHKNIRRLGEAHQKLLESHPDLGLILVGKKNAAIRANEAYFKQKGYRNILFTDFIPDSQRDWLYTNAAAYVFPSLMEGFGLPGLEAMGYGTPVVSSNATCLPEVYGEAAHYFNPLDTSDMARAIKEVLTDGKLSRRLITAGHRQLKKYSWLRMARQTHEVYLSVLKKDA